VARPAREGATGGTQPNGAQTLKQVVAPPYWCPLNHPASRSPSMSKCASIARGRLLPRSPIAARPPPSAHRPRPPPTSLLHQAASAAARERRKGRKRSCGSRLVAIATQVDTSQCQIARWAVRTHRSSAHRSSADFHSVHLPVSPRPVLLVMLIDETIKNETINNVILVILIDQSVCPRNDD
jgi:hypothetical protein